jgi:O-antigen ligase
VAIGGAWLLVFVLLVRPQEFVPSLRSAGLLNVCAGVAALGIAIELALSKQAPPRSPQLPWLGAFVGWCFLVTVGRLGLGGFSIAWQHVGLSAVFLLVIALAAGSMARWRAIAALLVAIGVFLSCTCIHQSRQPPQCIAIDTSASEGERSGEGEPDGRDCDSAWTCEQEGAPRTVYVCEKVGLFGTFTEGMRVRWRGTLGDPNELALALGAAMPLALAFASGPARRRSKVIVAVVIALALVCVVLTGSRGGQLVVLTVFGVYFVRRYGFKGALVGAVLALPVLLFGGRAGEEAESSSAERIELLYLGMDMIRAYPVLGVGAGQFVDHAFNGMTAHNSYVLAAAELGLPGSLLWLMLVYSSVKIPWVVATRPPPELGENVRPFALALVVAFAGILVGVFFLSFCYKALLFVYFGLSGALYGAVRRACPSFDASISAKEVGRVVLADLAVLALVLAYSHAKGGHA